jgi:serine protease Do
MKAEGPHLPSFTQIAKKLQPSVVGLYVTSVVDVSKIDPMFKFFKQYFGGGAVTEPFTQQSVGSGVIINEKGYILTNSHVVENVESIKVALSSGKTYDAKVIGADEATDLALVKIDTSEKLQPAVLGDSEKVQIGDWVVAIGTPFGLEASLTVGVISAIGRHDIGPPQLRYQDMIQTDAPMNPGNSGGPLVDLSGSVVGVTTAITASGQGIGFAIPINMAKEILPLLLKHGKVPRSWLGVTVQGLGDLLAKSFGMENPRGALVVDVVKDSPAWTSGLKVGDIILELDGNKITEPDKLSWYASIAGAGKKVNLKILRGGQEKNLTVKLALMPVPVVEKEAAPKVVIKSKAGSKNASKDMSQTVKLSEIDKYTAAKLGLGVSEGKVEGVLVADLDEDSPLAKAGLDKGDIILDVNGEKCFTPADFTKTVKKAKKGDILRIYIISKEKKGFIAVQK